MNNLFSLKKLLTKYNIDGYLVPKNDEYFQETSDPDRLKEITNFSGSAGIAIILKNTNLMFVDGRYTLQAKLETKKFKERFLALEEKDSLDVILGDEPRTQ